MEENNMENIMDLSEIINQKVYNLLDTDFVQKCKIDLDQNGVLTLSNFLNANTLKELVVEAEDAASQAYFTNSTHNVYLTKIDDRFGLDHVINKQLVSSKGCICTDQIKSTSKLKTLYGSNTFKSFIAAVVGETSLFPYDDPLSSINVHYAGEGQELNWHFDNSEFAITLLLQSPIGGGEFQYLKDFRNADKNEMNFEGVDKLLAGSIAPRILTMKPGTLVLFRGRNSIHRVTPTIGDTKRILVVLAYNSEPGIALSESARKTFYGRLS
jgi:hypothetical protein